ncbi:MAG: hypothetical protein O2910_07325 [Proteobacteria bacterium]|nr:hypothetical protein [Pseudomonadota bacterium]
MTFYANIGAPMGKQNTQHILSSLLGDTGGLVRCPTVVQVGIQFLRSAPILSVEGLLSEVGCRSPQELRDILDIPNSRLMARPAPETFRPCNAASDMPEIVLRHALILGLSSAQLFDPSRPIIWTEASLTRRLELYSPLGFYI